MDASTVPDVASVPENADGAPASRARVTVVVPTLNHAPFLECALHSIVSQRTPVDLIVVDGGSTDDTSRILDRWKPRMVWWRSRRDAGQSAAINEGMTHSSAPYVAWLNSDDWYLPGGLDAMVEALERNPDAPGVYADALNAGEYGQEIGKYWTQTFTRRNLSWRCFVSQPATLLRRSTWEALSGVDESLHYAMDYDLWWRVFLRFGPMHRLRQVVAVNRAHHATKTRSARRGQIDEAMQIVQRHTGRVPLKWYLAWPYSVWLKSWLNRVPFSLPRPFARTTRNETWPLHATQRMRALIVKLAAIGDVVMSLPMVSAIRAAHPQARITWMCGSSVASLLKCVKGIDEFVIVDERAMLAGATPRKLLAVAAAWLRIGGRSFDAVYIGHSDPRYRFLAGPVRAGLRRSLGGGRGHRALVQRRTHTDEYVRLVTGLDDFRAPAFAAPAIDPRLSPSLEARIDRFADGRALVALIPGGARNVARENSLRRWPLDSYAALARALDQRGLAVMIAGDSADAWVRPAFGASTLDLIGATTLVDLAALFRRCIVVVSHDTGPLHLARLVGAHVVALLGPTPPSMFFREERRTFPIWAGKTLPCAPCYDGFEFAACSNNVCMQMIGCEQVLEVIDRLTGRSPAAL